MARFQIMKGVLSDKKATPTTLGEYSKSLGRKLSDWDPPTDPKALKSFVAPTLVTGDVFESPTNMLRHNTKGSIKFIRVDNYVEQYDELNDKTVAELRAMAEEEELDLPKKLNKTKLVQAIRSHLSFQEAITDPTTESETESD